MTNILHKKLQNKTSNEVFINNFEKMTGSELRKIYKNSGLKGIEFASKLGIYREYLYDLFLTNIIEIKYVNKLQDILQKPKTIT